MQTGFALSVLSGVSCQGVLSVTIWCLKRRSVYIRLARLGTLGKWGLPEIPKLARFFGNGCGLCKRNRKGSLEKVSCICWMTLILSIVEAKGVRI